MAQEEKPGILHSASCVGQISYTFWVSSGLVRALAVGLRGARMNCLCPCSRKQRQQVLNATSSRL